MPSVIILMCDIFGILTQVGQLLSVKSTTVSPYESVTPVSSNKNVCQNIILM